MSKRILALTMCLLLMLCFAGCAAASKGETNDMAYAPEAENVYNAVYDRYTDGAGMDDYEMKEESSKTDSGAVPSLPVDRKLIQKVNMSVETENLDAVLGQIEARIQELGGYIQASRIHNGSAYSGRRYRNADMTIRIPADKLEQFVTRVGEVTNIVSSNKTVDDVTLTYVSIESRLKALQTEENRLLELLAQAQTMDDLLTIESRLTDVRSELEQVTSSLRVMDNQVNYATVELDISEVTEYTPVEEPETVWQRIGTGFVKSMKGVGTFFEELFVFLIVASPYFVLIAILVAIPLLIVWLVARRKRKNRQNKETK